MLGESDVAMYISHAYGSRMCTFAYPYPNPLSKCRSWISKYSTVFASETKEGRKDDGKELNEIFGEDATGTEYVRRAYAGEKTSSTASITFKSMLKPGNYTLHFAAHGITGGGGQNELTFYYTNIEDVKTTITTKKDEFAQGIYTADFYTAEPIRSLQVYVCNSRSLLATTAELRISKAYLTNR